MRLQERWRQEPHLDTDGLSDILSLSALQAILSMLQDMNFINNYKIDCPTLARYMPRTALGAEPQFPLPLSSNLKSIAPSILGRGRTGFVVMGRAL